MQLTLYGPASSENRRQVACDVCRGNRLFCVRNSSKCLIFIRAKILVDIEKTMDKTNFFGPSPPSAFLCSFGYPNLLAGPLVPAVPEPDPEVLDAPDQWLNKSIDQLIRYRIGLVRGKARMRVQDARNPDWVPLGVWRFRELARKAFENPSWEDQTLEEALQEVGNRMEIHSSHWINHSKILVHYRKRSLLDLYTG